MDMSLSKLQEIVRDREAWHAAVLVATKSQTWLSYWTAKYIHIYFNYNVILFSLKMKRNFDTCYNMGKPWRYYAEWNNSVIKCPILYDSIYVS